MIRVSDNVLYAETIFMSRLKKYPCASLTELCDTSISRIHASDLWDVAYACKWVALDGDIPSLTSRGNEVVNLNAFGKDIECLQVMLADYVIGVRPIWASRIPAGRRETSVFMTKDEKACFQEAGLLSEIPDDQIVAWWDRIAGILLAERDQNHMETGRRGEKCTLQYEKSRTGEMPVWVSIDSNLSGFDIKSIANPDNHEALLIEVKASDMPITDAYFYVSSNEWDTARASHNYAFYLWCFYKTQNKLAIIRPQELKNYMPTNNLTGKWESTRIPYLSFKERFFET